MAVYYTSVPPYAKTFVPGQVVYPGTVIRPAPTVVTPGTVISRPVGTVITPGTIISPGVVQPPIVVGGGAVIQQPAYTVQTIQANPNNTVVVQSKLCLHLLTSAYICRNHCDGKIWASSMVSMILSDMMWFDVWQPLHDHPRHT